jgi:hypothetical protein
VHGLFRASGIVMIYRLHHVLSARARTRFRGHLFPGETGGQDSRKYADIEAVAIFAEAGTLESRIWPDFFPSPVAGRSTLSAERLGHFWRADVG